MANMANFNFNSRSNAAVMIGDTSYVFFVNAEGSLGYLWFQGAETVPAGVDNPQGPAYQIRLLLVNNNPVLMNPQAPQVTAVAYRDDGNNYHIRLYYISPAGLLRELCADTGDANAQLIWFRGNLNNANFSADENTALASSVQVGGINQLKVYYRVRGTELFNVAFTTVGNPAWATRECFNGGD